MADDRTSDEEPPTTDTAEPVPEADALEQAEEVVPEEKDDLPSEGADVPEADAIEQSRVVPRDEEERP